MADRQIYIRVLWSIIAILTVVIICLLVWYRLFPQLDGIYLLQNMDDDGFIRVMYVRSTINGRQLGSVVNLRVSSDILNYAMIANDTLNAISSPSNSSTGDIPQDLESSESIQDWKSTVTWYKGHSSILPKRSYNGMYEFPDGSAIWVSNADRSMYAGGRNALIAYP
jgi:hypothetical protein